MTKLALSDEILMRIDKPARYIGNELNSIKKDKEKVAIRFAMCFPDVYEIGMSHLGVQILYDMFNKMEDVWCERVYSPWPDLHKIMKEEHIPLFGLESQEPIKDLDFIGFTLNYEMCYTNVLQILDLGQIPLLAKERTEDDPLVIGGGCCTYNPEPMADFFDLFYMGEGEISFYELFDLYKKMRAEGKTRHKSAEECVCYDDYDTYDKCDRIVYAEYQIKQFSTRNKSRRSVNQEENQNKDCRNYSKQARLVLKSVL